jgi:cytochrome c oxidase subunit 1
VVAAGLPLIGYGLIFNLAFAAVGAVIVVLAAFAWGYEPADDPEAHHAHAGHDGHGDGDGEGDDGHGDDDGGGDGHDEEPVAVGAGTGATGEEAASDD